MPRKDKDLGLGDLDDADEDDFRGIPSTFQTRIREALHPLLKDVGKELSEVERLAACSEVLLARAMKRRTGKNAQKK